MADFTRPDPTGRFASWVVGQFDPLELTRKQRMALQHLREELEELKRKADELSAVRAAIGTAVPTDAEKSALRRATFDFHQNAYSALGAVQAAMSKTASHLNGRLQVPTGMIEAFLGWLERWRALPCVDAVVPILRGSRDYRSIVAHVQQRQSVDWLTAPVGARGPALLLFGGARSEGQVPDGARVGVAEIQEWVLEHHDAAATIFWLSEPPDEQDVIQAIFTLVSEFGTFSSGMTYAREHGLVAADDRAGLEAYDAIGEAPDAVVPETGVS